VVCARPIVRRLDGLKEFRGACGCREPAQDPPIVLSHRE
jgi:hypothetical protein